MLKGRKIRFLLKLDFERAYNVVCWDYLLEVLKAKCFGPKWMQCISSRLYSAKINILTNEVVEKRLNIKRDSDKVILFHFSLSPWSWMA